MRELRFDGLSPDGSKLILVGKDGQRWSLAIDERIEAAVRRDRARLSQVELESSGVLRPREIQARIRAGATAEDVAAASGLPVEHIRRFEGPVLTERAWVAQQAQGTAVRRPAGDVELGDLVAERLGQEGVDPAEISWDAWRGDDGRWVVIATFPIGPNTHVATWTYDSGSRTMTVADDNARALSDLGDRQPLRLVARRPALASVAPLPEPDPVAVVAADAWTEDVDADVAQTEQVPPVTVDSPVDDDAPEADEPGARLTRTVGLVAALPADPGDAGDAGDDDGAVASAEAPDAVADEDGAAGASDDTAADDTAADPGTDEPSEQGAPPPVPTDEPSQAAPATEDDDADDDAGPTDDAPAAEVPDPAGPTADAQDVALFETPKPTHQPASRSGRPPVPSFDDILFGPGPKKG